VLIAISLIIWYAAAGGGQVSRPGPPSPSIGDALSRTVSGGIGKLPLQNQLGQQVTLAQFRGRVVFLVPFLTSCQEECPITTGALLVMQQALAADHLSGKVAIVELTSTRGGTTPNAWLLLPG
jgi:protein SCO1/2